MRYRRVVHNGDRHRNREAGVQLLQLGLESLVDVVILLGAVAHDEDVCDLLLDHDPAGPRARVALRELMVAVVAMVNCRNASSVRVTEVFDVSLLVTSAAWLDG